MADPHALIRTETPPERRRPFSRSGRRLRRASGTTHRESPATPTPLREDRLPALLGRSIQRDDVRLLGRCASDRLCCGTSTGAGGWIKGNPTPSELFLVRCTDLSSAAPLAVRLIYSSSGFGSLPRALF